MQFDTLEYYEDLAEAFDAGVKSAGEMHGDHGIAADWRKFWKTKLETQDWAKDMSTNLVNKLGEL